METMKANFLTQVVNEPTKGDGLLDLLLKNPPKIIKDGKVKAVFLP